MPSVVYDAIQLMRACILPFEKSSEKSGVLLFRYTSSRNFGIIVTNEGGRVSPR